MNSLNLQNYCGMFVLQAEEANKWVKNSYLLAYFHSKRVVL